MLVEEVEGQKLLPLEELVELVEVEMVEHLQLQDLLEQLIVVVAVEVQVNLQQVETVALV